MAKDKLEKKIYKKKKFINLCLFIIFVGVLASLGLKSNYFVIKSIKVENNYIVSTEEILTLSKIQEKNIFLINTSRVKEYIKSNPYIENVFIERRLPSTVLIKVEEKKLSGLIKCKK
jgi:cell division protein FtsQ